MLTKKLAIDAFSIKETSLPFFFFHPFFTFKVTNAVEKTGNRKQHNGQGKCYCGHCLSNRTQTEWCPSTTWMEKYLQAIQNRHSIRSENVRVHRVVMDPSLPTTVAESFDPQLNEIVPFLTEDIRC